MSDPASDAVSAAAGTAGDPAFVYETDIAAPAERVWAALTSGEFTRRYWFDRRVESDWAVGSPVRFYDGAGNIVTDTGVVLVYEPPTRLTYTFRQEVEPGDSAPPTRVAFIIEPLGDERARLLLVHDQLERPADVDGWRQGWTPILTNLQALLEGQAGPAPDGTLPGVPYASAAPGAAPAAAGAVVLAVLRFRLAAPPEAVYRALTEVDHVRRWWSPDGWTTTVRELDVRPGGAFALSNVMPDGTAVELRGTYREVVPGYRLSHTLRGLGDDRESLVTFELRPAGAGTHLRVTEIGFGEEAGGAGDSEAGWLPGLAKLAHLVTAPQS